MDKKTPRALLNFDIGGRRITVESRREGLPDDETPLFLLFSPYLPSEETVLDGQFNWGGFLQNSNGGAQRSAYSGWKSECTCIRISWLDCEDDYPIRCESRRK